MQRYARVATGNAGACAGDGVGAGWGVGAWGSGGVAAKLLVT